MKKKTVFYTAVQIAIAEAAGRVIGELIADKLFSKKKVVAPEPKKIVLEASNYELINRNLQKRMNEGVSEEEELQIMKNMLHNYEKIMELNRTQKN